MLYDERPTPFAARHARSLSLAIPPADRTQPSDPELVARVKQGDDAALGTLYDRHSALVYKLTRTIVGGDADAEEVTTDVFLQLWERADRFDASRGSLRAWLATIARSRALDHVRSRDRRRGAHERSANQDAAGLAVEMATVEATDHRAHVAQVRDVLEKALSNLNPDQRRAIELAYFSGLSQSEIASRLGEPLGTIKTRIRDGMAKLQDLLRPHGGAPA